jgi:hypothetical protein
MGIATTGKELAVAGFNSSVRHVQASGHHGVELQPFIVGMDTQQRRNAVSGAGAEDVGVYGDAVTYRNADIQFFGNSILAWRGLPSGS